jgi:uridine phosphorylase
MTSVYPSPPPLHHRFVTVRLNDVATPSSAWVVPGFRGKIRKITTVIDAAITIADTIMTAEIGGVLVQGSSITIAFTGSAAGTIDSAVPTGANTFTPEQAIEIVTDGAGTGPSAAVVTLELEPV